jgi:hypothetical protein
MIHQKIGFSVNDTLTFLSTQYWEIIHATVVLLKRNRLMVLDRGRKVVRKIIARKIGTRKQGRVVRFYLDKNSHEELFIDVLFIDLICPSF